MASIPSVKTILGTGSIGDSVKAPDLARFDRNEDVKALLDAFYSRGYTHIDTARDYAPGAPGSSELRLAAGGAVSRFIIDTKVHSGTPGDHEPANITLSIDQSLAALEASSVETMYLHIPDRQTPFEHAAGAVNKFVQEGKVRRFGLSNYSAAEVQSFIDVCEEKGYVKPSVYQGHYNPIVRGGEKELFPLLRKHNIAFYAYSPAAGGFFNGNTDTSARWSDSNLVGQVYSKLYGSPVVQASVNSVRDAVARHGISGHAAAMRWTKFHGILDGRHGDGLIFGVSNLDQLHKTLDALEAGPLPADLAEAITAVYTTVQGKEPPYHL